MEIMSTQSSVMEVVEDGYDEAILLDTNGYVAEGRRTSWAQKGTVYTTPLPTVSGGYYPKFHHDHLWGFGLSL